MKKQVISKQRVAEYGEVFTSEQIVNAMLDLVKSETERIDSRFLEPACGTGNFLTEILRRKLVGGGGSVSVREALTGLAGGGGVVWRRAAGDGSVGMNPRLSAGKP